MKLEKKYLIEALLKAKDTLGLNETCVTSTELEEYEKVVTLYLKKEGIQIIIDSSGMEDAAIYDAKMMKLNDIDYQNLPEAIKKVLSALEPAYYALLKCKKEKYLKLELEMEIMTLKYQALTKKNQLKL